MRLSLEYLRGSPYDRARLLYEHGMLFEARGQAGAVQEDDPSYGFARKLIDDIDFMLLQIARMHMDLGREYEMEGMYKLAGREYRTSLRYYPENPLLLEKLEGLKTGSEYEVPKGATDMNVKLKLPLTEDARAMKGMGPKAGPEARAKTHYMKGWVYLESGLYRKAVEEFERVLEILPSYMNTKELLERARAYRDAAVDYHLKRGIAHFQKEELELAIKQWDAVLELDPDNAEAADYRKRAYVIMESLDSIRKRHGP